MKTTWTKRVWITTLSLSLGIAVASATRAQSPVPGVTSTTPVVTEMDAPAPPAKAAPGEGKMPKTGQAPGRPAAAPAAQDLTAPPTTPDLSADTGALDSGSVATASSLGMQGRADANNRFNLFDNMAALPSNRVWVGYEYQNKFNPGVVSNDFTLQQNRQVTLYRAGAEIAIGSKFSIAVQDEYIGSAGSPDSWGNPQFMAKYVITNTECTVLSATLGFQPQVSTSLNELHERTTRFYPGILFFRSIGDNLFAQGGFQFGVATNDAPQTVDYALSFGYWLYRDPGLDVAGRRIDNHCNCDCQRHLICGIIPQVEILGKNVIGNGTGQGLEASPGANFVESNNTYDATFGARVLITTHMSYSLGFSFPITAGTEVRSAELLSYLNFSF